MREKLKKIAAVCKVIFGYSVMITLFIGGLTFFGYLAALIMGGDVAVMICDVIYKTVLPITIYTSTVTVMFGLVAMYLCGEKALTPSKKKAIKSEGEK